MSDLGWRRLPVVVAAIEVADRGVCQLRRDEVVQTGQVDAVEIATQDIEITVAKRLYAAVLAEQMVPGFGAKLVVRQLALGARARPARQAHRLRRGTGALYTSVAGPGGGQAPAPGCSGGGRFARGALRLRLRRRAFRQGLVQDKRGELHPGRARGRGRGFQGSGLGDEGYGARDEQGGEELGHHSVPLGGEAGRQALLRGDGGVDKGVVEQPLSGHVPARALDLLPARAQGHSPQARSALIICRRREASCRASRSGLCPWQAYASAGALRRR